MSHRPNAVPYAPRHANRRPTAPAPVFQSRRLRAALASGLLVGVISLVGASESTSGAGANALRPEPDGASRAEAPPDLAAAPVAPPAPVAPLAPVARHRSKPVPARPGQPGTGPGPSGPVHVPHPAPVTQPIVSGLAANGIPSVALNAYRVAAARVADVQPGCGVDWSLLAGIGRVESDHGRFAGAALHADGTSTSRIIGIPLDGSHSALIRDTDGGRLDGDRVFDRAVGPMQFIPSTWAHWGADADGDGVADPFDINDAALAAARYLCAAGGDLRTTAGRIAAVLSYNHSDEYVARVLALAAAYRAGVPVDGIPVRGRTTGALPPAGGPSHAQLPPVNPGRPLTPDARPATLHQHPVQHSMRPQTSPPARPAGALPRHPQTPTGTPSQPPSGTPSSPPVGPTPTPTPTSSGPMAADAPAPPPSDPASAGLLCGVLGVILPCPPPR
ncbi:MAG TPA: lytic murein transglycosylase [Jatrophihabitantaceae bacterium]